MGNKYQNLLDKLSITNFTLRGEYGEAVLDLINEYINIANSSGEADNAKKKMESTGLNLKALESVLDLPEEDLEKLIAGSSKFTEEVADEDLPEEYLTLKNSLLITKEKLALITDVNSSEYKEVEALILDGDKNLLELKQKLIQEKISQNPNFLAKNSKLLKTFIQILNTETPEYAPSQKSKNLIKIRKEIEFNFLTMKSFDEKLIEDIIKGTNEEHSLSKSEFLQLLNAIIENDELLNLKAPLFTNTQS